MPASTPMRRGLRIRGVVGDHANGLRQLEVSVDDNGLGGAVADGAGLLGARRRVERSGGTLFVTSPIGAGTCIRASFPLPESDRSRPMRPAGRATVISAPGAVVAVIGWWGFESAATPDVSRWNTAVVTAVLAAFVTSAAVGAARRPTDPRPIRLAIAAMLLTVSYFRFLHPPWLAAIGAIVWLTSPAVVVATFTEPAPSIGGRRSRDGTLRSRSSGCSPSPCPDPTARASPVTPSGPSAGRGSTTGST